MSTWEYQISKAIRENRNKQIMQITVREDKIHVLVKGGGCTLDLTRLPDNINLHWIKYDPSGYDESAAEAARWIAAELRRLEAGTQ